MNEKDLEELKKIIAESQEEFNEDFENDSTCGRVVVIICTRFNGTKNYEYLNSLFATWYVSANNPLMGLEFKSAKIIWDDENSRNWDMSR